MQKSLADREPRELCGRVAVELALQVLAVLLGGSHAYVQVPCDFLVRLAQGEQLEDLPLARRQAPNPAGGGLTMATAESHSRNLNAMVFYGWLAPIREPEYLAQMAPKEAHECRVLWARIKGIEAMLVDLIRQPD